MTLAVLERALAECERHVSPFFMVGDPTPELFPRVAEAAVRAGATMLELGLPFSDPVADGPAVQAACARALRHGLGLEGAFRLLADVRRRVDVPLNLLVYGNLVHAAGAVTFARRAARAGASSLLVPDLLLEEMGPLRAACRQAGLGVVALAGPATPADRLRRLADGSAFLYLAGRQGTTGARDDLPEALRRRIRDSADAVPVPLAVGFGLKTDGHVRAVLDAGARVAIVGSALLARISEWSGAEKPRDDDLLLDIQARVADLARGATPSEEGRAPCS